MIYINRFTKNKDYINFRDIISLFRSGVTEDGVMIFAIQTTENYVDVEAGFAASSSDVPYYFITLRPFIKDGWGYLNKFKKEYRNHHLFWEIEFRIENHKKFDLIPKILPTRNECFVSFVPKHMSKNYNCFDSSAIFALYKTTFPPQFLYDEL